MATGCLSDAQVPDIEGRESFAGPWYHTGRWPHEGVDFTGQRVAVIGTGSSAIQSIPLIAKQAAHVFVFQRTPNYSMPAHNAPLDQDYEQRVKERYTEFRREARESRVGFVIDRAGDSALAATPAERRAEYERRWARGGLGFGFSYADILTSPEANDTAAEFFRSKIRSIVRDPAVAETLVPRDYPLGTKRLCVDTDYYATFNRENVTLVDLRKTPIAAITPKGVRTTECQYEADSLVFATGFDAMTGALLKMDIRGRGGHTLRETWSAGPRTYLGLTVAGFPNLFTITGPQSPSVLSNMIVSIEQHVDWIAGCLAHLRGRGQRTIEATREAEDAWVQHVNDLGNMTLYPRAKSWYMGANVPGKPRIFMPYIGGVGVYREKCDAVAAAGYEGFTLAR
jgi:cyclohexanone monooxygenase